MKFKMIKEGLPLCPRCKVGVVFAEYDSILICKNCKTTFEVVKNDLKSRRIKALTEKAKFKKEYNKLSEDSEKEVSKMSKKSRPVPMQDGIGKIVGFG